MTIRLFKENGAGCTIEFYEKTASTVFTFNDVVRLSGAGRLIRFATGNSVPIIGLIQITIAATDSDYAETTRVPVQVCGEKAEYLCDVSTGTAAQTDVGEYIDFDDENSVDVDDSTNNELFVTRFISTTQVVAKIVQILPTVHE